MVGLRKSPVQKNSLYLQWIHMDVLRFALFLFPTSFHCIFCFELISLYGCLQLIIEEICRDVYCGDSDWQIILLRYFNPVGAHPSGYIGEDPRGIPNNLMPFVQQVAVGRRPALTVFGNDYSTEDGTGVLLFDLCTCLAYVVNLWYLWIIGKWFYQMCSRNGTSIVWVSELEIHCLQSRSYFSLPFFLSFLFFSSFFLSFFLSFLVWVYCVRRTFETIRCNIGNGNFLVLCSLFMPYIMKSISYSKM